MKGLIAMKDEKILADEILREDELENVAGGSKVETNEIKSMFINALMHKALYKKDWNIGNNYNEFLLNAGIEAKMNDEVDQSCASWTSFARPNYYYLDGESISHGEAVEHLKKFYGL